MYTVNCPWHVFHIVYVGSFWVEHLKEKKTCFILFQGWKRCIFWICGNIRYFPCTPEGYKILELESLRAPSDRSLWGSRAKLSVWALFRPKLFCYAISGFFYWNSFSVFRWQQACMPKFTIFFSVNDIASGEFCGFPEDFHALFAEKIFVYRYLIFQYSH